MLAIWAKCTQKQMQHAQCIGFGLGKARQNRLMLVMQRRSYQHWYSEPQTLPTAGLVGSLWVTMEKKMEATIVYWGNIGIIEKKMEATIVYWGNIGIMEKGHYGSRAFGAFCWGFL